MFSPMACPCTPPTLTRRSKHAITVALARLGPGHRRPLSVPTTATLSKYGGADSLLSWLAPKAGAEAGGSLAWHKYKLRWLPLQPILSVRLATWSFNSKGCPLGAVSVALLWRSTSPLKSRVPLSLIALLRLASKIAVVQMSSGAGKLMISCHFVTHCVHVAYRYFLALCTQKSCLRSTPPTLNLGNLLLGYSSSSTSMGIILPGP